jgi:hypothetical protein
MFFHSRTGLFLFISPHDIVDYPSQNYFSLGLNGKTQAALKAPFETRISKSEGEVLYISDVFLDCVASSFFTGASHLHIFFT